MVTLEEYSRYLNQIGRESAMLVSGDSILSRSFNACQAKHAEIMKRDADALASAPGTVSNPGSSSISSSSTDPAQDPAHDPSPVG